ncbi:MAG: PDZ domain-containing protein [Gammaproteobacteria bacterium]|nr:PDZ domain-containing protein [Gammaproteobacteria bacterium]
MQSKSVIEIKEAPVSKPASANPDAAALGISYAAAVELAAPAVVNIFTTKVVAREPSFFEDPRLRRFFGENGEQRQQRQSSLGSGVIVSEAGYILTNNHVIEGSDEILVALNDERTAPAAIVGSDPESDIAVLKIDLDHLPSIVLGHSENIRVGDVVLAIGNPFGVGQTVTQGIVSARNRAHLGISTFENYIQTDAAINPGNSGGALIDAEGHLIGINTAIFSRSGGSQGVGFAVPVSLAKTVMTQIIETGHAVRGWLGIEIQNLSPSLAESFGAPGEQGALIAGTMIDGPAAKAGLQAGDIVTSVDGNAVHNPQEALNRIAAVSPGSVANVEILRNGARMTIKVTVGSRPAPANTR